MKLLVLKSSSPSTSPADSCKRERLGFQSAVVCGDLALPLSPAGSSPPCPQDPFPENLGSIDHSQTQGEVVRGLTLILNGVVRIVFPGYLLPHRRSVCLCLCVFASLAPAGRRDRQTMASPPSATRRAKAGRVIGPNHRVPTSVNIILQLPPHR